MRYLSVCSGIEAATQAFESRGWEPVAFSEIEQFPSAVLAHHYPDVPNWGDMTKFKEWPDAAIDVLVGGTPCQSFSVAGLRKGLADPRGNLMLTYLAIAERYRPRWIVWENVPGVLSSNGGRDFGAFLGGLGKLGYGFAYRVLDAQFVRTRRFPWAVPQRRRRVFVIGYLGDWRRAAAVLFDRESLSGNSPPRREAGQVAPTIPSRSLGGGGLGTDFDCDGGLIPSASMCLNDGAMGRIDGESETFIPEVAGTMKSCAQSGGFSNSADHASAGYIQPQISPWAVRRLTPVECERLQAFPDNFTRIPYRNKPADKCPDGPRYKALGNSMAVNCMDWLGERIDLVEAIRNPALQAAE